MKIQWTLICALIFALITAIFAVINVEPVNVNFLFIETNTPLILVILSSTLLGGLIVGLFGFIRQYKQQRLIRQLQRQLEEAKSLSVSTPAGQAAPSVETDEARSGRSMNADGQSSGSDFKV